MMEYKFLINISSSPSWFLPVSLCALQLIDNGSEIDENFTFHLFQASGFLPAL